MAFVTKGQHILDRVISLEERKFEKAKRGVKASKGRAKASRP